MPLRMPKPPARATLLCVALVALPFVVYANAYHHAFVLDDGYTVVSNPSIRSLRNIPRFFVDPATYTTIREQAEYRPILQASYALNYRISGYEMWSWHLLSVLIHVGVTLGLFLLGRRVLRLSATDRPDRIAPDFIAFAAAALFAIHPAAAGAVDYVNARSTLLTSLFLVAALLAYMRHADDARGARPQWLAALFLALGLFTKVEAVGILGAFWAFELWQRGREHPDLSLTRATAASFDRRTLVRLAPSLGVTALYFVIRARLMAPFPLGEARHAADVGPYQYFVTQVTAWWYYLFRIVAPVDLVADYLAYPVYRTIEEPVVLLAGAGWLLVAAALIASWKRAPALLFLAIAAFAIISPTSTVAPLAEMVNEHRPYLANGLVLLALAIVAVPFVRRVASRRMAVALGTAAVVAGMALGALTWDRNEAFATSRAYWADVLAKAPSSRAYLNHGQALMSEGDMAGAMRDFRRSLELAPNWYFTHINLGVAYQSLGQPDSARAAFDRAVAFDRFSGHALTWRGEFHLARRDFAAARADFARSDAVGLQQYRNARGLAAAAAGLGDLAEAERQMARMASIDSAAAAADAGTLNAAMMGSGLDALARGDARTAAARFRSVLAVAPTHYGATYQLAVALDRVGQRDAARDLWQRVLRMAEDYRDEPTARTARDRLASKR